MSILSDEEIERAYDTEAVVRVISRNTARRYRNYVEYDDVAQELRLWLYLNSDKVREYEDMGEEGRAKINRTLIRRAQAYARVEKAERSGYCASDEFYYNSGLIKTLLSAVYSEQGWVGTPPALHGPLRAPTAPSEGNNWLTMLCDITSALEKLKTDDDRIVLFLAFGAVWDDKRIAEHFDITVASARQRVSRCVRRLQIIMGEERPLELSEYIGKRKAISNAQARAITERDGN